MNTSLFTADDDASDFAFANSTIVLPAGNDLYFPGLKTLQDLVLWYGRLKVIISVFAAIFTFFIIMVIAKEKSFHNTTNYFVANLMSSNLVKALCLIIDGMIYRPMTECGGTIKYLEHVMYQVSCCTLILLTLTRYDAIVNPLQSIDRWNRRRVLTAAAISWLASFIVQIPSYFLLCQPDTNMALVNHIYIYTIMFLIPLIILIFCYSRILCCVLGDVFRKKQLTVAKQQEVPGLRAALQTKLTRMVVVILLVFFLLRAPRATFVLYKFMTGWSSIYWIRDRIVVFTFSLMNQLNGAVDPFIYAFCAPQFRKYLAQKIRCRKMQQGPQTVPSVATQCTKSL